MDSHQLGVLAVVERLFVVRDERFPTSTFFFFELVEDDVRESLSERCVWAARPGPGGRGRGGGGGQSNFHKVYNLEANSPLTIRMYVASPSPFGEAQTASKLDYINIENDNFD